ncbi:MAG: glycosyltransferase family 2 protein [Elusimicrobiota bacterium]|nr:glycosyltransferase family 2 protein [Elusimicrobiota bacterium]
MKISIITASYNSEETIDASIRSVLAQTCKTLEYIVVDGGSSDGTCDIVKSFSEKINQFTSEPDAGIYDAMNKGIQRATGDVVGILNSDDVYANTEILAKVLEVFKDPEVAVCYGDLVYVSPTDMHKQVRMWKSSPYIHGSFLTGWVPPHPTCFVRREVYQKHGAFDTSFPLAADYELMLRFIHCLRLKSFYIPEILVKMRLGGASNKNFSNILKQNIEIFRAGRKNSVDIGTKYYLGKFINRLNQYVSAARISA